MDEFSKNFKHILLIIYALATWYIFSLLGFLPKLISLPVKDSLQKNYTSFYLTGYSDINEYYTKLEDEMMPVNVFDDYDVFSNGNIANAWGYYSPEDDSIICANEYGLEKVDFNNNTIDTISSIKNKVLYPYKELYVYPNLKEDTYIYYKDESWYSNKNWFSNNSFYWYGTFKSGSKRIEQKRIHYEYFSEILKKSQTNQISMKEFISILMLAKHGYLLEWFKEDEVVIFKTEDSLNDSEVSFTVFDLKTNTFETFDIDAFSVNDVFFPVSKNKIIVYCKEESLLYEYDLLNKSKKAIVSKLNQCSQLNYRIKDDHYIVSGLIDKHTAFVYHSKHGVLPTAYADSYEISDIIMDDSYIVTYGKLSDGKIQYHRWKKEYVKRYGD